jgi:methionyl-tRNA synthetase
VVERGQLGSSREGDEEKTLVGDSLYFQGWERKMKSMVTLEDFNKLDIRIGKVLSVEKVPDAEKLLKFIFDLGEEKRQIIAGMAEFYSEPSILEGKEMPLLLNIEPSPDDA